MSLLLLLACPARRIKPEELKVSILRFGEYEIVEGRSVHVRESPDIPCELGRIFGVDYRLEFPKGASGPIPVSFRWVHPRLEIPRLAIRGTESSGGMSNPIAPRGASQVESRSLWSIDHPEELVPGRYEFQIRSSDDSGVLASQVFELVGC